MVDRVGQGTNTPILVDYIRFSPKPCSIKPDVLKELYLKQGLSSNQIAAQMGVSKPVILDRLHDLGIRESKGRITNPNNYRNHEPPYGYRIQGGKLVPRKGEIKICRLVVELRGRKGWPLEKIASELTKRGYRNRRGNRAWHHHTVNLIFKRWNGKL